MAEIHPLITKAQTAAHSAQLLLDAQDIDGACNRAYYAMFVAARAALPTSGADLDNLRTHSGLISLFGLRLVKPGRVDRSLGHTLNRAHEIRLVADYTGDLVTPDLATWVVHAAAAFVTAMDDFTRAPF